MSAAKYDEAGAKHVLAKYVGIRPQNTEARQAAAEKLVKQLGSLTTAMGLLVESQSNHFQINVRYPTDHHMQEAYVRAESGEVSVWSAPCPRANVPLRLNTETDLLESLDHDPDVTPIPGERLAPMDGLQAVTRRLVEVLQTKPKKD